MKAIRTISHNGFREAIVEVKQVRARYDDIEYEALKRKERKQARTGRDGMPALNIITRITPLLSCNLCDLRYFPCHDHMTASANAFTKVQRSLTPS